MSKAPDLFSAADELTQILGPDLAAHFIAHRKALKKPMTSFAGQLMAKKLRAFPNPVAAVEQSILKGWSDVFPVEEPQRSKSTGVAAEREKLRQEIERDGIQGQAHQDFGLAGGLFLADGSRPLRPH